MKSHISSCRRILIATVSLACTSCASLPGAWYYQKDRDDTEYLYLAILNNTSKDLTIRSIAVPPFTNAPNTKYAGKNLESGHLLTMKLDSEKKRCALPRHAMLNVANSRSLRVDISSGMPTALPLSWRNCEPKEPR